MDAPTRSHTRNRCHALSVFPGLCIALFLMACAGPPVGDRPLHEPSLMDGVYEGSATGWPNRAVVRVTVKDHDIVAIDVLRHWELQGKKAEALVIQRIIDEQTPNVDTVSGATNSSWVLMNAVRDALEKARSDQTPASNQ